MRPGDICGPNSEQTALKLISWADYDKRKESELCLFTTVDVVHWDPRWVYVTEMHVRYVYPKGW